MKKSVLFLVSFAGNRIICYHAECGMFGVPVADIPEFARRPPAMVRCVVEPDVEPQGGKYVSLSDFEVATFTPFVGLEDHQRSNQAPGPIRPSAEAFAELIKHHVPGHHEIEGISINGQTGRIIVSTLHEGLEAQHIIEQLDHETPGRSEA